MPLIDWMHFMPSASRMGNIDGGRAYIISGRILEWFICMELVVDVW